MKNYSFILVLLFFVSAGLTAQNISTEVERQPPNPNAQNQPVPGERLDAKGTSFTVNKSGDKSLVDIQLDLTVDNFYGEATYNIWSYSNSAYLWTTDHGFVASFQSVIENLSLEEGDYSVDCFDSFGDGGILGVVTDVASSNTLISWDYYDYYSFGYFDFTATAPSTIPLSNWAFALIGLLALSLVFFKFRK